jgi:hypothetical protein
MPRRAVDELNADVLFERRQGAADGLQRAIQAASRLRQASRFGNMDECFKVFEAAHVYLGYRDSLSIQEHIVPPTLRKYTGSIHRYRGEAQWKAINPSFWS